jgi:hypothetical protein
MLDRVFRIIGNGQRFANLELEWNRIAAHQWGCIFMLVD